MNETTYRIKDELKRFGEEFEAYAKNQVQSIDSFQRLHAADVKRNKGMIQIHSFWSEFRSICCFATLLFMSLAFFLLPFSRYDRCAE